MGCEGELREPLDKAARITHRRIPTLMTGQKERKEKKKQSLNQSTAVCLLLLPPFSLLSGRKKNQLKWV